VFLFHSNIQKNLSKALGEEAEASNAVSGGERAL
jgi:hypothetical protein